MSEFASTLSPEAVKQMPMGQLREKLGNVFKFVNKINIYSNGKIDQISQDPYAIMAAFLASEPTKMAAFEELHSNLDEFQSAVQELEGQLASLKGQIDDFVSDVEEIDAEEAQENLGSFQGGGSGAPQNDNMMRGNPQSAGSGGANLGMSYSESVRHKRSRKHRMIRG
jgi:outer membrane murein-binding lipoprotein Lpp